MTISRLFSRLYWFSVRCIRGNRYKHLFSEIKTRQPRHILEIGTWNGKNALKMIKAAAVHHPVSEIHYYGFDLFEGMTDELYLKEISKRPPHRNEVKSLLESTGAAVQLFAGNTNSVLPEVLRSLPVMDMVFIDGGHSVATIQNDWDLISSVMGPNTVVIFDDYWLNRTDEGCHPVVNSVDSSQFQVDILPIVDVYNNRDFGELRISLARVIRR